MTLQNEKFEELIAQQLAATLDSQRGKALAAFQAQIAAEARDAQSAIPISRGLQGQVSRRAVWLWTAVPSLAAACLAVVMMVQLGVLKRQAGVGGNEVVGNDPTVAIGNASKGENPGIPGGVVASSVEVTQHQAGGVIMDNNRPVREIRQTTLRQRQWVDPNDHAVYTVTEPVEKVNYEQVHPF